MEIKEYLESGVLEAYILGSASEAEAEQLLQLKKQYSQIENALQELEVDMEHIAGQMAITPPPDMWLRISDEIDGLIVTPKLEPLRVVPEQEEQRDNFKTNQQPKFIEVEYQNSHIRVHKTWKWVFMAVFILSKIFLACAIYFYLENRQAQEQIKELKSELRQGK